ncbi:MAG: NADH-quinone oxidoreductase subunit M [Planctomycetota bacterium]
MDFLLWLMMLVPLATGVAIASRPAASARSLALWGTLLNVAIAVLFLGRFDFSSTAYQAESSIEWLPSLGLSLSIGVDSVAALLIALTALLGPICVLSSWTAIKSRPRLFYGWFMILNTAMVGVFAARDLVLFYVCFEFTLLPMFVIINEFGSSNRKKAAIKFFLYTFTGSLVALAGLVFVAAFAANRTGEFSFDIAVLTEQARFMTSGQQSLVMLAMLAGFAVKVPLFPVHTWLPLAHTEAPTAGSVILAGVLLKLGTYAIYRFVLPFTPEAAYELGPAIAILSIIGIVYAGLICWVQDDVKKLVAYSSVSHLGFCVLGLFALNTAGLTGSILYMINHGLSTGALFLLIGFMYERYHTRDMRQIGGLASKMPVWSTFMVFFVMASVGLPGLNGFVSEFLCTMGAFQSYTAWTETDSIGMMSVGATWGSLGPWFAAFAATGVIVAAIYLLTMTARVVWGEYKEPAGHKPHETLPTDLNFREISCLVPLAALCLFFGLYPKPLIDALEGPVNEQVALIQSAVEGTAETPDTIFVRPDDTQGDGGND